MSRLAFTCRVDGKEVTSHVDSARHRSAPVDATDLTSVYDAARSAVSAPASSVPVCSRIVRERPRQSEDLEWISKRMTPSCAKSGYNPNDVVSYDRWTCHYVGKGTVVDKATGEKREVFNPFKTWSGTIASCATLDETSTGLGIPDSTMLAVQKMAYYQADGDASDLDVNNFLCRVQSLPIT